MSRIRSLFRGRPSRLAAAEDGVAAVEFSLFAPILIVLGISALDLGLAFTDKMGLDHVIRAGAAAAIENADESRIEAVMLSAEKGAELPPSDIVLSTETGLTVSADRYCECPGGNTIECDTNCDGPIAPYVFYDLTAARTTTA